jgi:hypothetical protein
VPGGHRQGQQQAVGGGVVRGGEPRPKSSTYTGYPPVLNDKWEEMPSEDEMVQVRVLLAELTRLKADKLIGATVAQSFSKRLTQPIQDRFHPGYEYLGRNDLTRVRNRKVSHREVLSRVTRIVSGEVCDKGCPKAYCLRLPTTKVRSASFRVDSIFFRVDFSIGVLLIVKLVVDSTHWIVTLPGYLHERVMEFWCPQPLPEG